MIKINGLILIFKPKAQRLIKLFAAMRQFWDQPSPGNPYASKPAPTLVIQAIISTLCPLPNTQSQTMLNIESSIIELRNQQVILDSDVAIIYGVATRDVNKAVKNNPDKFPKGYIFELSKNEKQEVVENFHHLESLKFSPTQPKAFTEKGLYMLATILKSGNATKATLQIIETFAKIREFSRVAKTLALEKDTEQKNTLMQQSGRLMADILNQEFANDTKSETTIELNLAMLKIKHTIKK